MSSMSNDFGGGGMSNSMMGGTGYSPTKQNKWNDVIPKGYQMGQLQQYTPEQMALFKQQFGQTSPDSYLSRLAGGDQSMFNQMEEPALRQFSELQGGIASRFSGMGMGGRRSSGFQNASNQAATDFASSLQSRRQDLQRQAIKDLHGMSQDLLGNRPEERFLIKEQQKQPKNKWWQSLLGGAAPAAGAGIGFALGGPSGALAGGQIGNSFGQSFQ